LIEAAKRSLLFGAVLQENQFAKLEMEFAMNPERQIRFGSDWSGSAYGAVKTRKQKCFNALLSCALCEKFLSSGLNAVPIK
jgi:hypothetical protein